MDRNKLCSFKSDISNIEIPKFLNNPFGNIIPKIARIAAKEFQDHIAIVVDDWEYDFNTRKGKMFGVLVVQTHDSEYAYLRAVSGRLSRHTDYSDLVPSVFDDASDDYFINKGMTAVTELGTRIKEATDELAIATLKAERRLKSISIQKKLFEHYDFLNLSGNKTNLLEIFSKNDIFNPPSATGECAAPKLIQYALQHKLKPIAIAEFWWGKPAPKNTRIEREFYPACLDKCKPILEYMLEDSKLYSKRRI
jgi:tRNA pseudouridine32 synthase/23S rRNA pseudouridine746 synthase